MEEERYQYVIGVDGGGSKTVAALADLDGKVLKMAKTGSASARNVGLKKAISNVALAIKKILKKENKIASTFLGLPCLEEEFKFKKEKIKKELLKHKEISPIFKGKIIIDSDQLSGFRSGTDKKSGICLIAGSGQVVHGWFNKKEMKVSGWGYLTEKGCALWVGIKALEAIFQELDGSGSKTLITKLVFEKLKIRDIEGLINKVYSKNQLEILRYFSILVDQAAEKKDKVAQNILKEASGELIKTVKPIIEKLFYKSLKKEKIKVPLVLIGSMFKSRIILKETKKGIKKLTPKIEIIQPKVEPVVGAVKLAIEAINN